MLHMCKSHDHGSKFVEAFLVKNDLFDPSDPYMTFDPWLVMWHNSPKVRVIVTKFGRNQSKNVEVICRRSVARRRKRTRQLCHRDDTYRAAFFDFLTEHNENKKNAQLGPKSVNIKFTEQKIQFDPGFTPLSCEITKIEKAPNWV